MSNDLPDDPIDRDMAVALRYDKATDEAPLVVAKGYGEVARKIVETAQENDVVIETNPQLAEALSGVGLDETIPIELYQAVAEVIGFVLKAGKQLD